MKIIKISDKSTEVEIDKYINVRVALETDGFYCVLKPNCEDSICLDTENSKGYRVLFTVAKGILKGTPIEVVDSYLDITQVFKYVGDGVYTSDLLGLKAIINNEDNSLSVAKIVETEIKSSTAFN